MIFDLCPILNEKFKLTYFNPPFKNACSYLKEKSKEKCLITDFSEDHFYKFLKWRISQYIRLKILDGNPLPTGKINFEDIIDYNPSFAGHLIHREIHEIYSYEKEMARGASGALMVWGVKIVPRDLDIFVSATDIAGFQKIFQKYVTNPLHNFEEGDKKYLEFQMRISEVKIEICELDFKNEEIIFIDFKGRKIPVNPLEKELELYERRSGKKDRVELIKRRLAELSRVSNMI